MSREPPQIPIKPPRLEPGDTIGVVAPASPPAAPDAIDRGIAALESLGFKVRLGRHARARLGFLAGPDRDRAADLMRMFTDRQIKAILCVRGGYGAGRLLPLLDYDLIRRHPKIFAGQSDITALLCALRRMAGLVTFHGPMLIGGFAQTRLPAFTRQSFMRTVCRPEPPGNVSDGHRGHTVKVLREGIATGELIGGNLSVLCSLLGTPYQPDFRGRILFFEDVNEPPYRIDRLLTQLLNAGLLQQVAGIAIGINRNCADTGPARAGERRQTLEEVLQDRLVPLKVPVVVGLPFGHVPFNATIPIGVHATLDGTAGKLIVTEPAVT
ncbi:MAG: LD-carboxypeptidase [Verrucomicrobiae bacterium]|nr:LD-carboxypeptidase [Verrucomicrobiae bacterium]MDW7980167.1 LD-carboxypeptidase [Verrucomicrobiales bacterium]